MDELDNMNAVMDAVKAIADKLEMCEELKRAWGKDRKDIERELLELYLAADGGYLEEYWQSLPPRVRHLLLGLEMVEHLAPFSTRNRLVLGSELLRPMERKGLVGFSTHYEATNYYLRVLARQVAELERYLEEPYGEEEHFAPRLFLEGLNRVMQGAEATIRVYMALPEDIRRAATLPTEMEERGTRLWRAIREARQAHEALRGQDQTIEEIAQRLEALAEAAEALGLRERTLEAAKTVRLLHMAKASGIVEIQRTLRDLEKRRERDERGMRALEEMLENEDSKLWDQLLPGGYPPDLLSNPPPNYLDEEVWREVVREILGEEETPQKLPPRKQKKGRK